MQFSKRGSTKIVTLDPDEIATAIDAYLVARRVYVGGPRTVRWEPQSNRTTKCVVIVDPSGKLIRPDGTEV